MNYRETLDYIHSLGKFSKPVGLSRISAVLKKLGNPQNGFRSIHIAGTNGKGSVSAMLAKIFEVAGCKTGLYISPFIIDFRERIQICGEFITEEDTVLYANTVKDTGAELTEFEFITAMAFLYFRDKKCDIAIVETGLGGRFDATNALDNVTATVITKIGLDHSAVLGDTVDKIASEKCGIIKDSPVTVTSCNQRTAALNVIKSSANRLIIPDISELEALNTDINGSTFIYKGKEYTLSLCGEYQIENALTVIETAYNCGFGISYKVIKSALLDTFFPARAEIISKNPLVVLDGAHNPDGGRALSGIMKKYDGEITALIGLMRDKDYKEVLSTTLKYCENAVTVTVKDVPRALPSDELLKIASRHCRTVSALDYSDAIRKADELSKGKPIFVFGSLYLASGIRDELREFYKNLNQPT